MRKFDYRYNKTALIFKVFVQNHIKIYKKFIKLDHRIKIRYLFFHLGNFRNIKKFIGFIKIYRK